MINGIMFEPNFLLLFLLFVLLFTLYKALWKRKHVKIMIPADLRFTNYNIFKV